MKAEDLRRAIELPSRKAGLRWSRRSSTPSSPTSWTSPAVCRCSRRRSSSSGSTATGGRCGSRRIESGGVRGAVARIAEEAFEDFTPEQRQSARSILLRLASVDGDDAVRRRAPLSELELEANEDAARVVAVLTESRLVTVSEDA